LPRKPEGVSEGYMKKITISGIGCNPGAAKNSAEPVPCMLVWGIASGTHSEPWDKNMPDRGVWTCLVGEFQAVNLQSPTKDLYESAWLFLPQGLQDVIQVPLEKLLKEEAKEGLSGGSIVFGLEFQAVSAKNPSGYSWRAINRRPMEKQDSPMSRLRLEVEGSLKALPAPAPEEKKAAARR
jgi:hypothetical protein